jgi:transcription elongation factor GreA
MDYVNGNPKVHLTQEGFDELKVELERLQAKEPQAVDRVTKAREFGDLSENSEYHAAREDLALIQGRLDELEDLLARATVIKNAAKKGVVDLGCKVTVTHDGNETTFVLVGDYEADPQKRKISHDSPLGQALIGKKVGETAEFVAPVGKVVYTIKKID